MESLSIALKEWHLAIGALLGGEFALLLRKGGILESENQFVLEHARFLFYPTFVHQDPRMVKAGWRERIEKVDAEPSVVAIRGWGEVVRIFEVPSRGQLEQLGDLHIWDVPMLDMRFNYRPEKPLYVVVVRAHRLLEEVRIPQTLEYAGCKSWVPLQESVETGGSVAAMDEGRLQETAARIGETFRN